MFNFINTWYKRYFTDPQASLLVILVVLGLVIFLIMGKMLAPLLAALIIAYLLEGAVSKLEQRDITRFVSVNIVYFIFLIFMGYILFGLMPLLSKQVSQFFQEVPEMVRNVQSLLLRLPEQYPDMISEEYVWELNSNIRDNLSDLGQNVLSVSLASVPAVVSILVYLILVPLMIFFFLKDKKIVIEWTANFLPKDRQLVNEIWVEMDAQIGNYIRGKFNEILIVGSVSYIAFVILGLNYAFLLAMIVGLSVLIPYIGAAIVTLPIALVGYFQWGLTSDYNFTWLMISYFVIQFLDGNVLVPILFSEAVNLHPLAIIVAILVFGGIWGFWGVFFAIPLATLVKALINVWPVYEGK
ncbi:MAG: AI-2E family transporter [Legionellales bacterium]|jgi:putative permease|nr:AI-2E family transporter [Legionellales bacterium]MBK69426.1 AI-2E family transporter [Legionellales bacterium]|tara:strand:+ start:1347 stop:2408 length:1062 start_codon:yes stop_codon:yes gene_type:complete